MEGFVLSVLVNMEKASYSLSLPLITAKKSALVTKSNHSRTLKS